MISSSPFFNGTTSATRDSLRPFNLLKFKVTPFSLLEEELPAASMGSKKSHDVHNSGGNGGGGGTKAETGDSCPTNSAADGSITKVKGAVAAAFMQWILVEG
jgi:hypothetical protein